MGDQNKKDTAVSPMGCAFATGGIIKIDKIAAGLGIIIYSSAKRMAAGAHVMMAASRTQDVINPGCYANTAIPHMLDQFKDKGVGPPFSVALAGGAAMLPTRRGDVGIKLIAAIKEALSREKLQVKIEKTGGAQIRSIFLDIDQGKIKISDANI